MAKLPLLSELTECPHCGSEEFYIIEKPAGHITRRGRFDGGECDNTHMFECLASKPSAWVHCGQCEEKIARNDGK